MTAAAVINVGCAKNQVDSEVIAGELKGAGYTLVDIEEAEVIVVNTCGFITAAKEESIAAILGAARYKEVGKCRGLVVVGCMVQKYQEELARELPEVDAFIGAQALDQVVSAVNQVLAGQRVVALQSQYGLDWVGARALIPGSVTGYLKIAEGCSHRCTFCVIPQFRGPYRSRPIKQLLQEAQWLLAQGVRELVLIAQDTTRYGQDLDGERLLPSLLRQLANLEGYFWVRVLYCYPEGIQDELLEVLATEPKVCRYLDIPMQHADPDILRQMGRKGNPDQFLYMIEGLRRQVPEIALRTTLMVGFPGETGQNFINLLEFVRLARFDWAGVFTYSREPGTVAAKLPRQVDSKTQEERMHQVMLLQREITIQKNWQRIGQTVMTLVEGLAETVSGVEHLTGRTEYQAPEVDGVVLLPGPAQRGDLIPVIIREVDEYDLIGERV